MTEAEKEDSSSKSNLTGENLVGKIETLGTALLLLSVTSVFVWMWLEPALQSEKSRSKFMGQKCEWVDWTLGVARTFGATRQS